MAMSEETRRKLNRALWRERAKMAGIGLAILAAIGAAIAFQNLDLAVENRKVAGVVEKVEPLVVPPSASAQSVQQGLKLTVKLDDGPEVHVIAEKSRDPHIGDRIDVVEHKHGTGRVTHSLK